MNEASKTFDILVDAFGPKYAKGFFAYAVIGEKVESDEKMHQALSNLTDVQSKRLEKLLAVIEGYHAAQEHFRQEGEKDVDENDEKADRSKRFAQSCLRSVTPSKGGSIPIAHMAGTWRLFDMGSPLTQIRNDAEISVEKYRENTRGEVIAVTVEPMGWW